LPGARASSRHSAPARPRVEGALDKVEVKRALIIGVKTGFPFPIFRQQELAEGLSGNGRQVEYHELDSLQGHDSFLVDMDRYRPIVAKFFG
jgi:homoserine O-acetyltransferase/O-succinyltransferase